MVFANIRIEHVSHQSGSILRRGLIALSHEISGNGRNIPKDIFQDLRNNSGRAGRQKPRVCCAADPPTQKRGRRQCRRQPASISRRLLIGSPARYFGDPYDNV